VRATDWNPWREAPPSHALAIAHRAGNHPWLLEAATLAGVDVVEADVWPHRGRLEVRHLKTMGPIPLLWDRWKLEPAWRERLLLSRLLEAVNGPMLMLDLKGWSTGASVRIKDEARDWLGGGRTLTVCARNWKLLEPFMGVPGVNVVHSMGDESELLAAWKVLEERRGAGVSIHQRLLTEEVVTRLRGLVPVVMTWPINDEEMMRRLTGWGVNGIISDRMEVLEAMVAARVGEGGFAPDTRGA
jgi:hypothetical protein